MLQTETEVSVWTAVLSSFLFAAAPEFLRFEKSKIGGLFYDKPRQSNHPSALSASGSKSPRRKNRIGNASSARPAKPSRELAPAAFLIRKATSAMACAKNVSTDVLPRTHPSTFPSTARWKLRRRMAHKTVSLPMT